MANRRTDLYSLLQAAEQSEPMQASALNFAHSHVMNKSMASYARLLAPSGFPPRSTTPVLINTGITPVSQTTMLSAPSVDSTPSHGPKHDSTTESKAGPLLTSDNPIAPNAVALEMARLNYLHQLQQYQQWQFNIGPVPSPSLSPISSSSSTMGAAAATSSSAMDVTTMISPSSMDSVTESSYVQPPITLLSAASFVSPFPNHLMSATGGMIPPMAMPLGTVPSDESQREHFLMTLRELFPIADLGVPADVAMLNESILLCELCGHEEPNKVQLNAHHRCHRHRSGSYKCDQPRCRFDGGSSFHNLVSHRQLEHQIKVFGKSPKATSSHHDSASVLVNPPSSSKASTPVLPDETPDSKSPRKSYKCQDPGCDSTFQSYSGLKYHQLLHSGSKEHRCTWPGCNAAFTNSSGLKIHKMTHDPASKAWKCNWDGCKAAFTTSSALSTHIRTHTGAKPYHCTWSKCDKNFARADHLKIHLRSHTNERPYVCESCSKGFTNSSGLRTHEKTHKTHPSPESS